MLKLYKKWGIYIFLLAEVLLFSAMSPKIFFTFNNFLNILRQTAMLGIVVVGVSFVMIGGAFDMSVGGQIAVDGIICALLMVKLGVHPLLAALITVLFGTIVGATNGLLVVKLHIAPLVTTLGTMTILQAVAYIITKSKPIYGWENDFSKIGQGYIGSIPIPVIIFLLIAVICSIILKRTYFGRNIYAMGGSPETARLAGINIDRLRVTIFSICGALTAIASLIMLGRVNSAQSAAGASYAFDCMTAAVLGGVSFAGGEGKIMGAVVGAIIIAVLGNALQILQVNEYWQDVFKGVLMIVAVALDNIEVRQKSAAA